MAAFLTTDRLRALAAPGFPQGRLLALGERPCPTLSACWQVSPDGALTCRWLADERAPDRPPL